MDVWRDTGMIMSIYRMDDANVCNDDLSPRRRE